MSPAAAGATPRTERAWSVLEQVSDPEIPVLSLRDLGIVRDVLDTGDAIEVVLTPTYSGCPATEVIERSVIDAIEGAGLGPARVRMQRAPAWTTDWISADGKAKLREYGIAPPGLADKRQGTPVRWAARPAAVPCPRCGSGRTEQLAAFGATPCKSLWRCLVCREPFEHFKPI